MTRESQRYDIIGDVHGCHDELVELLDELGYVVENDTVTPPAGRSAIFLGDLVDRGPKAVEACRLVMGMVAAGTAQCVLGNHELQMLHYFRGKTKVPDWGLPETLEQLAAAPPEFTEELRAFAESLPVLLELDEGRLLAVHAGLPRELHGRDPRQDKATRRFALYGGYPEDGYRRREWASSYRGGPTIVYGHTPTDQPRWINDTICIDTGCVYGGSLTALRYPERELVSVAARTVHYHGA